MSNAYNNMGSELKGFNTSDTLVTIDSLWAGWYEVVVYDLNHCSVATSSTELRNAEVPQLTVTGTEYPNGYYYSCDTCIDAEMTAIVNGGSGEYTRLVNLAKEKNLKIQLAQIGGYEPLMDVMALRRRERLARAAYFFASGKLFTEKVWCLQLPNKRNNSFKILGAVMLILR